MSNIAQNRKIKADRVYKTLGKMSWQRVVLGIALLVLILFLSGTASELFFKGGHYRLAEHGMISEKWMEKNKPDTKALIDAGYLYACGDADGAYEIIHGLRNEENYRLNARNFSSFCDVLSEYYRDSDPERSNELQTLSAEASSFAERPFRSDDAEDGQ